MSLPVMLDSLSSILRETDFAGWYKDGSVVGVVFTQIAISKKIDIPAAIMRRLTETLKRRLPPQQVRQIDISLQLVSEKDHDVALDRRPRLVGHR